DAAIQAIGPAAGPATKQVNNLLATLASADWNQRQNAIDELAALGPLVEAPLRARLKDNPDPGAITAIESLLHQIGQNGKIAPTLITLKLEGVSPAQAAAAFARQAKIEFAPGTDNLWIDSPKKID